MRTQVKHFAENFNFNSGVEFYIDMDLGASTDESLCFPVTVTYKQDNDLYTNTIVFMVEYNHIFPEKNMPDLEDLRFCKQNNPHQYGLLRAFMKSVKVVVYREPSYKTTISLYLAPFAQTIINLTLAEFDQLFTEEGLIKDICTSLPLHEESDI